MRPMLSGLAAGLLFGHGLTVSGMIDPAKVLGFLDITGDWDPSLAFVMGGAIPVAALGGVLARRRAAPACAAAFVAPSKTRIDTPLCLGALLFGIGWGLGGYCPGPALASLLWGGTPVLVFVAAMLAGMMLYQGLDRIRSSRALKERSA